jgi:hypothetical protein
VKKTFKLIDESMRRSREGTWSSLWCCKSWEKVIRMVRGTESLQCHSFAYCDSLCMGNILLISCVLPQASNGICCAPWPLVGRSGVEDRYGVVTDRDALHFNIMVICIHFRKTAYSETLGTLH